VFLVGISNSSPSVEIGVSLLSILMKEANYYQKETNMLIRCNLCPHHCLLENGKRGFCGVRKNINGKLYSEIYGKLSAISFEPIEKKPLYHYYPGSKILSLGSIGCNMNCKFCQNWRISQATVDNFCLWKDYSIEDILNTCISEKENLGIAYTYNEPIVWYEYMSNVAKLVKEKDKKNVMITNGYISKKPLEDILEYMDAFNIDIKSFSEEFYEKITSSTLSPVLETIKRVKKAGKHIELTFLIIPGLNDDIDEFNKMLDWIVDEVGKDTVLHLSRYFPMYLLKIKATPIKKMEEFYYKAKKKLGNVYLGNVHMNIGQNTYCQKCGNLLIERNNYSIQKKGITENGICQKCAKKVEGLLMKP